MIKKVFPWMVIGMILAFTVGAHAAQSEYVWVKDQRVSSQNVLKHALSLRMIPMDEAKTLEMIRTIMATEMKMTLAGYDKKNRQQIAQTTAESMLPEEIAVLESRELAAEDYMLLLEVQLKAAAGQTSVLAIARPVYRVRDTKGKDNKNGTTISIKTDQGQAVAMGTVLIMPIAGQPMDYHARTLPDAEKRCANLVRYFISCIDQQKIINRQPETGITEQK